MKTYCTIFLTTLIVFTAIIEAKPINDAIIEQMIEDYQLDTTKYEIEIISNRIKQKELNNEEIVIKALTLKDPLGLFTIIATIFDNGEELESSQVRMRIKKFETVLVSSGKLKRHSQLTTSNTSIEKVEVTNLRNRPYLSVEETEGYRLKGSVQNNIPITSRMLEKIPDIISGRETTIVYTGSIFKITADGIALQSGSEGDYIKVKNKTSNKIIVARVIDSHHVAVSP